MPTTSRTNCTHRKLIKPNCRLWWQLSFCSASPSVVGQPVQLCQLGGDWGGEVKQLLADARLRRCPDARLRRCPEGRLRRRPEARLRRRPEARLRRRPEGRHATLCFMALAASCPLLFYFNSWNTLLWLLYLIPWVECVIPTFLTPASFQKTHYGGGLPSSEMVFLFCYPFKHVDFNMRIISKRTKKITTNLFTKFQTRNLQDVFCGDLSTRADWEFELQRGSCPVLLLLLPTRLSVKSFICLLTWQKQEKSRTKNTRWKSSSVKQCLHSSFWSGLSFQLPVFKMMSTMKRDYPALDLMRWVNAWASDIKGLSWKSPVLWSAKWNRTRFQVTWKVSPYPRTWLDYG